MTENIEKILQSHYVDGVIHTHVSMVQPRGKFRFNREGLENFWDTYCSIINKESDIIIGIAEKPRSYLPILVDVDIKIKDDGKIDYGDHIYSKKQLLEVIETYQSVIRNIVHNCNDKLLQCVVLEKPIYYITTNDETYAKNGFHLHFPKLFLSRVDQEVQLIPRVQKVLNERETFKTLGIESSGDVIDKSCCKVPWLMYGSRKSEDMDPYIVTDIISSEGESISLEEAFHGYELLDRFESPLRLKGRVKEYLPRILSIFPYGRKTYDVKNGLISPLKEKLSSLSKKPSINNRASVLDVKESLKVSSELLPLLDDFRSSDRNEWIRIGWLLYNIGNGSSDALDQWLKFSARCDESFDENVCIYEWKRMVKKDLTLGTLRHLAKKDNPEKYQEFKLRTTKTCISGALSGSHWDIAQMLYAEYGDEFVCASVRNKNWFQFRHHKWEEIEEGIYLRARISSVICPLIIEENNKTMTNLCGTMDPLEEAKYKTKQKLLHALALNLKKSPFKTNIMKECVEVFYDSRFKEKLNQNPYLIGFKNGVYDLKECRFRDGYPEDFISKSVPIDYKEYDETSEEVQQIIEFLQKVFPDKSIRKYFLDTYSDIFVGGNSQKKVYLWTGEGDNGKSITQTLFEKMLGELAIKFNTQYFTGKKTSTGSANPELARAAPPVRHVTMEEPDADETLNIGELKKLSGGDSYWARDLFEKGKNTREVFPQFTLTWICNKLPRLKYSDKATWNRLRVIPFESTFVEPGKKCPKTFEQQMLEKKFPMDKTFGSKIPGMVGAFAWYLLKWRQTVTTRNEPDKVKEATAIYRRQNDIYRQFIEECILEDGESKLSLAEIYSQYKEWFKEGWPNMSLPIKNDVKEYFEKLWGTPSRGFIWVGFRIRTIEESIAEGTSILLEHDDLVDYENNKPPL